MSWNTHVEALLTSRLTTSCVARCDALYWHSFKKSVGIWSSWASRLGSWCPRLPWVFFVCDWTTSLGGAASRGSICRNAICESVRRRTNIISRVSMDILYMRHETRWRYGHALYWDIYIRGAAAVFATNNRTIVVVLSTESVSLRNFWYERSHVTFLWRAYTSHENRFDIDSI